MYLYNKLGKIKFFLDLFLFLQNVSVDGQLH